MDKVFQVFVSSTYEDLKEERQQVREALAKAGYMPAGMEFFPAVDEQQLKYIKRIIDRSDYYVVMWGDGTEVLLEIKRALPKRNTTTP
jgi:hypothetical protein